MRLPGRLSVPLCLGTSQNRATSHVHVIHDHVHVYVHVHLSRDVHVTSVSTSRLAWPNKTPPTTYRQREGGPTGTGHPARLWSTARRVARIEQRPITSALVWQRRLGRHRPQPRQTPGHEAPPTPLSGHVVRGVPGAGQPPPRPRTRINPTGERASPKRRCANSPGRAPGQHPRREWVKGQCVKWAKCYAPHTTRHTTRRIGKTISLSPAFQCAVVAIWNSYAAACRVRGRARRTILRQGRTATLGPTGCLC